MIIEQKHCEPNRTIIANGLCTVLNYWKLKQRCTTCMGDAQRLTCRPTHQLTPRLLGIAALNAQLATTSSTKALELST